jgi:hypothetical protein
MLNGIKRIIKKDKNNIKSKLSLRKSKSTLGMNNTTVKHQQLPQFLEETSRK